MLKTLHCAPLIDYKEKLRLPRLILKALSDLTATHLSIHFLVSSMSLTLLQLCPWGKASLRFNPETGFRPSECFLQLILQGPRLVTVVTPTFDH